MRSPLGVQLGPLVLIGAEPLGFNEGPSPPRHPTARLCSPSPLLSLLFLGRSWPGRNVCLTTVCLPQVPGAIRELVRDGENNAGARPTRPHSSRTLPSPASIGNPGFAAPRAGCSAVLPAPRGRVGSSLRRAPKLHGPWAAGCCRGAEPPPVPPASACWGNPECGSPAAPRPAAANSVPAAQGQLGLQQSSGARRGARAGWRLPWLKAPARCVLEPTSISSASKISLTNS